MIILRTTYKNLQVLHYNSGLHTYLLQYSWYPMCGLNFIVIIIVWYIDRLYRTDQHRTITKGTVMDSGSEYTGFIGVISRYMYKAGKFQALDG